MKLIKNSQSKGAETKEIVRLKGMIKQLQEGIEPDDLKIGGASEESKDANGDGGEEEDADIQS